MVAAMVAGDAVGITRLVAATTDPTIKTKNILLSRHSLTAIHQLMATGRETLR